MERHEGRIFGLCLKMLHNRSDALEASQEIFITAFRRASSFRGDSAFGTWLYRIGINHCKDMLRKRKDLLLESDNLEIERVDIRQRGLDEVTALRLDLSKALAQLPDDYREAVVMHDLGGVPYEEIAAVTEVPVGTVKSRISRGRRQLARLLEHAEGMDTSKDQT
jgi:RNA polymerase sigma-70 factor, ECF subfamily